MSTVHTIIHTMQASYYDNQPKINHTRSNTQRHNIATSPTVLPSPTRLVSPLLVPSGQRGWLSLHQRWRSLLSTMRRPPTQSAPSDPPMSTASAVDQRWRSPPSIQHRPPTSSVPSRFFRSPVSADLPRCRLWDISASLAHRLYIVRWPRRQWKVTTWFLSFAGHTCSRLPDNGRSPVFRDAARSEVVYAWRRVGWSLSLDTVCLTRHLQARRHPPASLTAVDCSPPPWQFYSYQHACIHDNVDTAHNID